MKSFKAFIMVLSFCSMVLACGAGQPDPAETTGDLSSQEQAEVVAAALSADTGGVGQDIDNIARPSERAAQRAAQFSLTISAQMNYYDAEDNLQAAYDPDTTDRIDYESLISGRLSSNRGFFQELSIDNHSDFMATERLSGTAIIDGAHSNHSSYSRTQALTNAQIHFSLACDLTAVGVAVDLDAADTFPEAGTIEGTVSGSYKRVNAFGQVTKELYFHFVAVYLGNNTAEIELNDGTLFIVRLDTGDVQAPD